MPPDELLPKTVWLLAVVPPPRFPITASDAGFPPEDVNGGPADVALRSFEMLESWGYGPIGLFQDADSDIDALAFSSASATVWIISFGSSLSVAITPEPETDPTRLNHHLPRRTEAHPIPLWGTFPVRPQNVPAAAKTFTAAAADLRRGGVPN